VQWPIWYEDFVVICILVYCCCVLSSFIISSLCYHCLFLLLLYYPFLFVSLIPTNRDREFLWVQKEEHTPAYSLYVSQSVRDHKDCPLRETEVVRGIIVSLLVAEPIDGGKRRFGMFCVLLLLLLFLLESIWKMSKCYVDIFFIAKPH
jgi:hypothetical protein